MDVVFGINLNKTKLLYLLNMLIKVKKKDKLHYPCSMLNSISFCLYVINRVCVRIRKLMLSILFSWDTFIIFVIKISRICKTEIKQKYFMFPLYKVSVCLCTYLCKWNTLISTRKILQLRITKRILFDNQAIVNNIN